MPTTATQEQRIRNAWAGRISGCMLGKPVELLSMLEGYAVLTNYLTITNALPLRDYVPLDASVERVNDFRSCCRGLMTRSEPDDDIHYSVLALTLLEQHGRQLTTEDVARVWLNNLPAAATFTAEREAYRTLLNKGHDWFSFGHAPGFDLAECADNAYNNWIGAQIRADVYGWVCPGDPKLAAELVTRDAQLSHREDGIFGAVMVAATGAAIPTASTLRDAVETGLRFIPKDSAAAAAVALGIAQAGNPQGYEQIHKTYTDLSPVHTVNNLALVIWSLLTWPDDFSAAIGEVVCAGWDTNCNGATVGGLWGLQGKPIPVEWTAPWQGRVGLNLAGLSEVTLEDLISRTLRVIDTL